MKGGLALCLLSCLLPACSSTNSRALSNLTTLIEATAQQDRKTVMHFFGPERIETERTYNAGCCDWYRLSLELQLAKLAVEHPVRSMETKSSIVITGWSSTTIDGKTLYKLNAPVFTITHDGQLAYEYDAARHDYFTNNPTTAEAAIEALPESSFANLFLLSRASPADRQRFREQAGVDQGGKLADRFYAALRPPTRRAPEPERPPNPAGMEAVAVANLRTVVTAQISYHADQRHYGTLQDLMSAGLLDSRFASTVSGYTFQLQLKGDSYEVIARPTNGSAGRYAFTTGPDQPTRYTADLAPPGKAGQPYEP